MSRRRQRTGAEAAARVVIGHRLLSWPAGEHTRPAAGLAGMLGDAPLDDGAIAGLLRDHWRLAPSGIRYARIGSGSYRELATATEEMRGYLGE